MIRTTLASFAICLVAYGSALADDDHCRYTANCDYEIRERLLSTPVWIFEWTRAQRTQGGLIRFEKQGYKLIAHVDTGMKCEDEVKFVEGGFTVGFCSDPKKFVQVDDAYQSLHGTYILTIRPPR